jgi:adenylosuccinate lyase
MREWPLLPHLLGHAHAATPVALDTVEGLEIDAHAMARNLEMTHGLACLQTPCRKTLTRGEYRLKLAASAHSDETSGSRDNSE